LTPDEKSELWISSALEFFLHPLKTVEKNPFDSVNVIAHDPSNLLYASPAIMEAEIYEWNLEEHCHSPEVDF
jgi:hypothetical protein